MSQMTFQNIRDLGANGNQPLITNQNDYQIFDNVTWIKGKHTVKSGGSLTLRSREILNPDTITGVFNFNNNMTSNCAGQPAGCSVNSSTGFDVASFMLGLRQHQEPQPVRRGHLHREASRVLALHAGRLPRDQPTDAQPRTAVGRVRSLDRGRQSTVELRRDDRQVRRRVGRRSDRRRQGRSLPADLLEARPRSSVLASPTTSRATERHSCAAASGSSGTSRPAARRRRRRRTRRSSRRRRSNATPSAYGINLLLKDGLPAASGRRVRHGRRRARRGRSSTSTSATPTPGSGT